MEIKHDCPKNCSVCGHTWYLSYSKYNEYRKKKFVCEHCDKKAQQKEKEPMESPKYKCFDQWVYPVIRRGTYFYGVSVLTRYPAKGEYEGEETLSSLTSKDLRELADYLDYVTKAKGGNNKQ